MMDVPNIDERREALKKKLEETDNRIKSLQNRRRQLEKETDEAIAEKDKIKKDLTCHARLMYMNVVHTCRLEIGHRNGHSFEVGAYTYTVIEEEEGGV